MLETNPELFWEKYENTPDELKKREKAISKDAKYAYNYARFFLKGPFPAGEAAIAKDGGYSLQYAKKVLKKDFYLDGKLIARVE